MRSYTVYQVVQRNASICPGQFIFVDDKGYILGGQHNPTNTLTDWNAKEDIPFEPSEYLLVWEADEFTDEQKSFLFKMALELQGTPYEQYLPTIREHVRGAKFDDSNWVEFTDRVPGDLNSSPALITVSGLAKTYTYL